MVGLTFFVPLDLQPLTITDNAAQSYLIKDGDIPCTPEIEPSYNYVWNFCADVTNASFPAGICHQSGSAIQYISRSDGFKECNVIGLYDKNNDDTHFSLLNSNDPSKGISVKYSRGQRCPGGTLRTATIDVVCGHGPTRVESAQEPSKCDYHLVMRSEYGCPLVSLTLGLNK